MGNAVRILPTSELRDDSLQVMASKDQIIEGITCEFGATPDTLVAAGPLPLVPEDGTGEAPRGLQLLLQNVHRYFRLLIAPPANSHAIADFVLNTAIRARAGNPAVTFGLASREPGRGWTWVEGKSYDLQLDENWTAISAVFEAWTKSDVPVAMMFHFSSDAELEIGELVVAADSATGHAGKFEAEIHPQETGFKPAAGHIVQRVAGDLLSETYFIRRLQFDTLEEPAAIIVAEVGSPRAVDVLIEAVNEQNYRIIARRRGEGQALSFRFSDHPDDLALGDIAPVNLELAAVEATFLRGNLRVQARFQTDPGLSLAGIPVDLVADTLVLQRGVLKAVEDGFVLDVAVAASAPTAQRALALEVPLVNRRWGIELAPPAAQPAPPASPDLVPEADAVEGSFDGVTVSASGTPLAMGWARDLKYPDQAVVVDLFVEGSLLATGYASAGRADVAKRRGGSPTAGFSIEIPSSFGSGETLSFETRPRSKSSQISSAQRKVLLAPVGRRLEEESQDLNPKFRRPAKTPVARTFAGIILTQDGVAVLGPLLKSLERFEQDTFRRLIVIDHESTDESEALVKSFAGRLPVEFISRPRTSSFSESNNYGAALCDEDVVVFLNNDLEFTAPVVRMMSDHLGDDVGVVGLKLMDPKVPKSRIGLQAPQHVGVHFTPHARGSVRAFESRLLTDAPSANDTAIEAPAVTAAFIAMDRKVFEEVGGFDEDYFYGWEDSDLCLKASAKGLANVSVNNLSCVHVRGYSRRTMPAHLITRRAKNGAIFLDRWEYTLVRSLLRDMIDRPGFWSGRRINVGFVLSEIEENATAGDYMTALDFARALMQQIPAKIFFFKKRDAVDASEIDILIVMTDDFNVRNLTNLGLTTLLVAWPRNWFNRWAVRPWRERFNLWFASSQVAADYLEKELGRKVAVLPIGSDVRRFADGGGFDEALEADVSFTGHNWGAPRDIAHRIEPVGYSLKIFGKGWEQIPTLKPFASGALPYDRMADVYKSSKIVVDDSNFATATWGSLNSRVFDALAAGTLVVTNNVVGSQEQFAGLLPTYTDRASLQKLIKTYLADPEARAALVDKLRTQVLGGHTYDHRAAHFVDVVNKSLKSGLRIAIKLSTPSVERSDGWGDWYFAKSLRRELEALGHNVRLDCLEDWRGPHTNRDEVNIVLRGLDAYKVNPRQINILWLISHPNKISPEELAGYDRVFVASKLFAERLATLTTRPVEYLPQCTDDQIFHLPEEGAERHGAVFVGNSRLVMRPVIQSALEENIEIDMYGDGWRGMLAEQMIKSNLVSNELVGDLYRKAEIVLNDHWADMREWGFISNRMFDAIACGTPVLTDDIEGLAELFGPMVRTFTDSKSFGEAFRDLQAKPPTDAARKAAAKAVIANHSFRARAKQLDAVLREVDVARDHLAPHTRETVSKTSAK